MIGTEGENMARERAGRLGPIEAARVGGDLGLRLTQAGAGAADESGYYDDDAGAFVPWFTLGVSRFGDGSRLR